MRACICVQLVEAVQSLYLRMYGHCMVAMSDFQGLGCYCSALHQKVSVNSSADASLHRLLPSASLLGSSRTSEWSKQDGQELQHCRCYTASGDGSPLKNKEA